MITYNFIKLTYKELQYETDNELLIIFCCILLSCFIILADIITLPLQIIALIVFTIKNKLKEGK